MKKTKTEVLIHTAGPYSKDIGQSCIICGFLLTAAVGWENDDPTTWEDSHLILVEGSCMLDLSFVEEGEEDFPDARRCHSADDDESIEKWL